jgi:hypothetical protein
VGLDGAGDERARLGLDRTLTDLVQVGGAEVGGEENDGVLEVDLALERGEIEVSFGSSSRSMTQAASRLTPLPSVRWPSSRTWRKTVTNSRHAFSISSTRICEREQLRSISDRLSRAKKRSGRRTHESVRLAADELGQLATTLEADVAGRGADKPGDGVLLRVLARVDADHGVALQKR